MIIKTLERAFNKFNALGWFKFVSDKTCLKILYHMYFGKKLNLENPQTFNEKLQWLKLYDRKPEYTRMVDKYEVKKYVAERIGEQYIVPTYGVWDHFDEIDFDRLPEQFVLKCTHDSGSINICKNKKTFDKKHAKKVLENSLKVNMFWMSREWPYKNVKPRIIAEKYLKDLGNEVLPVYKFMCFDGEPKIIQTIQNDKQINETIDYFDIKWNLLKLRQNFPNSVNPLPRPKNLEHMIEIARILSKDIPFVRVDLYEVNGETKFSEHTFYSDAGNSKFEPEDWDKGIGSWIKLPEDIYGGGYVISLHNKKLYAKLIQDSDMKVEFNSEGIPISIDEINKESLTDYKFFCFEGIPRFFYISKDKSDVPYTDFYDMNGERLLMRMKDPNSYIGYSLPKNFEKMKELATKLSESFHHLRVDFYECDDKVFVGELTFYHSGGFAKIQPHQWEKILGDWIILEK